MASLPRPSRPSTNNNPPPTSPLPSVPASSRQSGIPSLERPVSSASSPSSAIPQRLTNRTASSSSVNSITSTHSNTPAATQSSNATASTPQPGKTLRKTISYNSFPRPPAGSRTPSVASNPSSNSTTPRSSLPGTNGASGLGIVPGRSVSLKSTSNPASAAVPASVSAAIDGVAVAEEEEEEADDDDANEESPRGRQRPTSSSTAKEKDKGNVVISVRVRPEKEAGDGDPSSREWAIEGKQSLVSFRGKEGGEYYYDNVFTTKDKNARVYDQAAKRLVRRVMEGYNGTVFAYGMTGTGKTFSMQGTATSPGVIPLAITDIFSFIRETPQREFLLRVSYLEIYNEKIFDLLATAAGTTPGTQQEDIKLREDNKGNVYATPLKEEIVQSPTQLLRVISRGDQSRRTYSTQFNARSSRSHAVVQIVVESRERNAGAASSKGENKRAPIIPGGVRVSTLSLIDLAGSERAAESKERRTEGAHINKSLLTLGTVISKLSGKRDKQGQPTDKDGKHLPYRDSKLTRLLQPALSGNSLISILCTIQLGATGSSAVAGHHTIETLNTLKFAARARNNIVSHAKKAEEAHGNMGDAGSRALLDRYRLEILELRKQLEDQKTEKDKTTTTATTEDEEKAKEAEAEQRREEQMIEMQLARTALKERIEHLNRLILSSKSFGVNAGRSYSSLSLVNPRISNLTDGGAGGYSRSVRSSASTATLDPSVRDADHRTSGFSVAATNNGFEDEEDTMGEMGDGTATLQAQVKSLQADLSDKNRYIATLEKRLLQARRSSRSRVSMGFTNRYAIPPPEEGGIEGLLQSKDAEIAELREKLDDKDKMMAALRSAARKRDTADTNLTSSSGLPPSSEEANSSPTSGAQDLRNTDGETTSSLRRRSTDGYRNNALTNSSITRNRRPSSLGPGTTSIASSLVHNTPAKLLQSGQLSPRSPNREKKNHGVDEMTRMLDEMIRQKMESESNQQRSTQDLSNVRRHSLLSNPNAITPLSGLSNGNAAKGGYRNVRLSTDGNRLSGWEPNSNRRRRSSLLNQGPPPSDGLSTKPLPDPPTKRRGGSSKDYAQVNGSSPVSSPTTTPRQHATSPTSSSSAQTQVPGSYNTYSNSTAAASEAIEALRPNAFGRKAGASATPFHSSSSSLTINGRALVENGQSTDDTSGDDDAAVNNERAVNGENGAYSHFQDSDSDALEHQSVERANAVAANSG